MQPAAAMTLAGVVVLETRRRLVRHHPNHNHQRDRIPTGVEIERLWSLFNGEYGGKLSMSAIMDFALASALRVGEICRIPFDLIGGIFLGGWVPARTPTKLRTVADFPDCGVKAFSGDPRVKPDVVAAAVLSVLRRQISPREDRHVTWTLRKPLHDLWMR